MRELTASPKKIQAKLKENRELVVTNNGNPSMLVIDISNRDFMRTVNNLRRQEALDILHDIQMESVRNGGDKITMEEIDAEIAVYRSERKKE